jgi:hypothetical protein
LLKALSVDQHPFARRVRCHSHASLEGGNAGSTDDRAFYFFFQQVFSRVPAKVKVADTLTCMISSYGSCVKLSATERL